MQNDAAFVEELAEVVRDFFGAVEAWEAEYAKYYRLSQAGRAISPDLAAAQSRYIAAYRALRGRVDRARQLCIRFQLRDPWAALLRLELGAHAPQSRPGSALGRGERNAVMECLVEMRAHLAGAGIERRPPVPEPSGDGIIGRLRRLLF